MKKATNNNTHILVNPCAPEAYCAFTPQPDGRVELFDQVHPDIPGDISFHTVERARELYRAAVASGMVADLHKS